MIATVTCFCSKEIVISLEWASSIGQTHRYILYTYCFPKCIYIYMAGDGSNAQDVKLHIHLYGCFYVLLILRVVL
jgi:hypothetical protein